MLTTTDLFGNTPQAWLIAIAIGTATYLGLATLLRFVVRRLAALSERTSIRWDDLLVTVLGRTKAFFLLTVAVLAGTAALTLPGQVTIGLQTAGVLSFLIQAGIWGSTAVTSVLVGYQTTRMETDRGAATMVGALTFLVKVLLWSVVLLLALDNLGIDVTALVAGLGVGGIAVALAAQNILGDLFASLAIVLDKPFVLQDFIIVGDYLGTVEHIGLKTTRLRSLSGEHLVFSNADLLASRIRNYSRMVERRVAFKILVTYETPRHQLERIPSIIRQAIEAQPTTRFDRSHFVGYGEYGLEFESVYYVLSPDYNVYMDIHQAINLAIHERFEEDEIRFALPVQRLYVERGTIEPAVERVGS